MDNESVRIVFENGSSITGIHQLYSHLTEFRRGEWPAVRGYRTDNIVYDEFAGIDLTHEYVAPENNGWLELDQYEFFMKDGLLEIRKREAPDFGEFSPSQELNYFINTLNQGE